jgi:shikimate kinase
MQADRACLKCGIRLSGHETAVGSTSLTPRLAPVTFCTRHQVQPSTSSVTPESNPAQNGNIVLIGFMGSGKSSIGRLLASQSGRTFVDTDQLVVSKAGMEISEIFAKHGEALFRDWESEVLTELPCQSGMIVSTGGGIILREENRKLLRSIGFVVWLTASEEEIFRRVTRNSKRPLVQTENPRETIHTLLEQRTPLYCCASDCVIDTGSLSRKRAAEEILRRADQYYDEPPKDGETPRHTC